WCAVFWLSVPPAAFPRFAVPRPPPAPAGAFPDWPPPPTAVLWVSVRLLAVRVVPLARFQPSLVIAPPRPHPALKAPLPPVRLVPPTLSLPPWASLWSKVQSVTVAVALSMLIMPPPLPSPTWPRP